ncbi:MAG: PD40 domain-containing protein, partial [Candidatus Latescibacteria bacterium]|nr:PD40 domain-containing protein [Candidatus Latescibacterota bacterium]
MLIFECMSGWAAGQVLQISPTVVDVGIVTKDSSGTALLSLKNTGKEQFSVRSIRSNNGQFTVSPTSFRLAAGDTQKVTVTFSPTVVGWAQGTLVISYNAEGSPDTVRIGGIGRVTPPVGTLANTRIAFESNRDGKREIYVMNVDGTNPTRLTNNEADDTEPAWAPDGTKLAFVSNRNGNTEIYTMNANGTNPTRLTSNPATDETPNWAPFPPLAVPDFTINAMPSSRNVTLGNSTTYTVVVTSQNGFTSPVNLTVTGLPSGTSPSFTPASVTPPDSSTLTITTGNATPQGSFTLTITGSGGGKSRSAQITLVAARPRVVSLSIRLVQAAEGATILNKELTLKAGSKVVLAADGIDTAGKT